MKILKYIALGLPGALLPSHDLTSMTGDWFSLGLPPLASVKIGYVDNPHRIVNMQFPDVVALSILVCIWTAVAFGVIRLRQRIRRKPTIPGAVLQAGLTLAYGFLLLVSAAGVIQVVWTGLLCRADWATLATAFEIAKWAHPPLCVLGAIAVLVLLWVDSFSFAAWHRAPHGVAAFLAVAGLAFLSVVAQFQWEMMDELARYAREELKRPSTTQANQIGQQAESTVPVKAAPSASSPAR